MLGELYYPKGQALETAQAVLEVEKPMAVNVAYGCVNKCAYCFGRKIYGKDMSIRFPKVHPVLLIEKQLKKGIKPEGVFISFMTDPMLDIPVNIKLERGFRITTLRNITFELIEWLSFNNIKVALLSKSYYDYWKFYEFYHDRQYRDIIIGTTVVSTKKEWYEKYEPNAVRPNERIKKLKELHELGFKTWLSFEPDPPPAIFKHDPIRDVLHKCAFVDLVVYGKMNYLKGSNTKEARQYYAEQIPEIEKFCKEHNIKLHVKKKTIEFVKNVKNVKKEG